MGAAREFDLVLWGATGFTGKLVARYLAERAALPDGFRWAVAARNEQRLTQAKRSLGLADIPSIVADSDRPDTVEALAKRAKVVLSTVGPYARHGSPLVAACAAHGTHYCDITGETYWVREMIDRYDARARDTGARIVPFCGFDAVPSDLGALMMDQAMRERHGTACAAVRACLSGGKLSFARGTIESLIEASERFDQPTVRQSFEAPYYLNPEGHPGGPDRRGSLLPEFDRDLLQWTAPFFMESTNTRVVRWSNALQGDAYGRQFRYKERMPAGKGLAGFAGASAVGGVMWVMNAAIRHPRLARLLRTGAVESGDGPSEEIREGVRFLVNLSATSTRTDLPPLHGEIRSELDPGYGETAKMVAESALCLALQERELPARYGLASPAAGLGNVLLQRLCDAHMEFTVEGQPFRPRSRHHGESTSHSVH